MTRTYHHRKGSFKRLRYVKNSLYKRYLHIYSEDFKDKRKHRELSRSLRNKLKIETRKEIQNEVNNR